MKPRIGELLVQHGIVTSQQLKEALSMQKKKTKKLGEILIELGYLSSKSLIWMLSEQADIPFVEVKLEMLDSALVNRFPEQILYKNCAVPLYETEEKIFVAQGDPTNPAVAQALNQHTDKEIVSSGADPNKIAQILDKLFLAMQHETMPEPQSMLLRIQAQEAVIEIVDSDGNKQKKQGSVDIIINTSKDEGGKND